MCCRFSLFGTGLTTRYGGNWYPRLTKNCMRHAVYSDFKEVEETGQR